MFFGNGTGIPMKTSLGLKISVRHRLSIFNLQTQPTLSLPCLPAVLETTSSPFTGPMTDVASHFLLPETRSNSSADENVKAPTQILFFLSIREKILLLIAHQCRSPETIRTFRRLSKIQYAKKTNGLYLQALITVRGCGTVLNTFPLSLRHLVRHRQDRLKVLEVPVEEGEQEEGEQEEEEEEEEEEARLVDFRIVDRTPKCHRINLTIISKLISKLPEERDAGFPDHNPIRG